MALALLSAGVKRRPDGSGVIQLIIEPDQLAAAEQQIAPGEFYALAGMVDYTPYGSQAQQLFQSSFFRSPNVWECIGTDEQYQAWVRTQKCIITGGFDWREEKGEGRCDYCHVHRAGDAGTGFRPRYMGVPMVHAMHDLQHRAGELAVCQQGRKRGVKTADQAREWFGRQALKTAHRWAWVALKEQLGFEHWNQIPPRVLRKWATRNNLQHLLPEVYR